MNRRGEWDSFRPIRPFQPLWVALGLLFLLPGLPATYLRVEAPTDDHQATFASFSSYGLLAYALAAIFFLVALLRARRRAVLAVLLAITVGLLACHAYWLAPLFIRDDRPPDTPTFALMSLNMKKGAADPDEVWAAAQRADLVDLLEATPEAIEELERRGWDERFRYVAGEVRGVFGDTVLYSRFPLSDSALLPRSQFQQWISTVDVPQVGKVRLIAAHPCNPYCGQDQFRKDHQVLRASADANRALPLIIAGDLNATDDHAPIRQLRADGFRSVVDIVGAGWVPTFPANWSPPTPALVSIDHVLVSDPLTATSVSTLHIADTDHLGLMVELAGTRGPG